MTEMTTGECGGNGMAARSDTWAVTQAKASFSELIERARSGGPQTTTRNGRPTTIVVSIEDWDQRTKRRGTLAEFFASSPLRGADIVIERTTDGPRELEW